MAEPGDEVTWREAAAILGVGTRTVGKLVAKGELSRGPRWQHRQLSRAEVEALALRRWNPRAARPDPYWLGTKEAAELLGSTGPECGSSWPLGWCHSRQHRTGTRSGVSNS